VSFRHGEAQTFVLEGKGRTVGLARILWRFDLSYRAVTNAQTLRPVEAHQVETARGKRIETNLKFSNDGVNSRRYEGAGLGLPIVYQIVNAHNGAISVRSQKGAGTTVIIEL